MAMAAAAATTTPTTAHSYRTRGTVFSSAGTGRCCGQERQAPECLASPPRPALCSSPLPLLGLPIPPQLLLYAASLIVPRVLVINCVGPACEYVSAVALECVCVRACVRSAERARAPV